MKEILPAVYRIRKTMCVFFLIAPLFLNAQAPNWLWSRSAGATNGPTNRIDDARAITYTPDGNIVVAGYYQSLAIGFGNVIIPNSSTCDFGQCESDIFIVKYDPYGNVIWAKSAKGDNGDVIYAMCSDPQGNIYVTGEYASTYLVFDGGSSGNDTLFNYNQHACVFVAKFDASGNEIWAAKGQGVITALAKSICVDNNGNVIITGIFQGNTLTFGNTVLINADTTAYSLDIFVAKFYSSGNLAWAKKEGSVYFEEATGVCADQNGNVIICGTFYGIVMNIDTLTLTNNSISHTDIFVIKYDALGNLLWVKQPTGVNSDNAHSICCNQLGDIFITGGTISPDLYFGSSNGPAVHSNGGVYNFYIAKYNSFGNAVWASGAAGPSGVFGNGICTDANGNLYVVGEYMFPWAIFGNDTLFNAGNSNYSPDIFVAKYNSSGSLSWLKSSGSSSDDVGSAICSDQYGDVVIAGSFKSPTITFDQTLANTGTNYDAYVASLSSPAGTGGELYSSSISIYPNPFSSQATISSKEYLDKVTLAIYNSLGQNVSTVENISGTSINLDGTDFLPGVYFYELSDKYAQRIKTGKFIINH